MKNFGNKKWYKINNKEELTKIEKDACKEEGRIVNPLSYPAYVKWGDWEENEKLYKYEGSSKIVNVEILSDTRLDGSTPYPYGTKCTFDNLGNVFFTGNHSVIYEKFTIKVMFEDGTTDTDYFYMYSQIMCLAQGTKITLANYTTKNIEDITYEDQLLVWDFDNGCFSTAKPLWIKKVQEANEYNYIKFEDGRELKTVVDHRIFNMDSQRFTYTMNEQDTPLGTKVFLEDGATTRITEREVIHEKIEYYNIITDYHMNLFANGILTSLRLNNLYEIKDMKFIKDDRELVKREEYKNIPDKYFNGLRLAEQPKEINKGNDVKHTNTLEEYVQRIINMEK